MVASDVSNLNLKICRNLGGTCCVTCDMGASNSLIGGITGAAKGVTQGVKGRQLAALASLSPCPCNLCEPYFSPYIFNGEEPWALSLECLLPEFLRISYQGIVAELQTNPFNLVFHLHRVASLVL
jgi:hypothetical protein